MTWPDWASLHGPYLDGAAAGLAGGEIRREPVGVADADFIHQEGFFGADDHLTGVGTQFNDVKRIARAGDIAKAEAFALPMV